MTMSYFLCFIDKVALSNASILGLRTDNVSFAHFNVQAGITFGV